MMTLRLFAAKPEKVPAATSWYMADLGESRGKQELFTRQSPQRLKVLREHALIESAVSSNRIEGVTVDQARIGTLVFGKPLLRDRDEEEVRGYRDALKWIHERGAAIAISQETILRLRRMARGRIWDAGRYKEKDGDIIERFADGRKRVRFKTVPAARTQKCMNETLALWGDCLKDRSVHPLIALAGFNLDFLCIHPFRDGNGRVSRLLLLLGCYHLGYEVGRYVSLERLIEENKERYYETLQASSQHWHEGKHDPWPYINYLLYILKTAYAEFESRLGQVAAPRGSKTELVIGAITRAADPFRVAEIHAACPGTSLDLVRKVLKALKREGKLKCLSHGQGATWQKASRWV